MDRVHERLQQKLQARADDGALRTLQVHAGLIDLSSNDYLGFARDPELKRLIQQEIASLPAIGSGGSRLLTGNNSYVELAEQELAAFHDAPSALFFNSGYEANSGLLSSVVHRHDIVIYDELIHASLREGIRSSGATAFSYTHNSVESLERLLELHAGNIFIITESVFSMDGDLAPLKVIVDLSEKFSAALILDEAHATGVIGELGQGLAQHLNVQDRIFARVHTFGKAMGTNGAVVLGSNILRDYLINFCRPFIYSTAPNFLQLASVRVAYSYMQNNDAPLKNLHQNMAYMRTLLKEQDLLKPVSTDSAIFSFIIPGNEKVRSVAAHLRENGFDVRPILSPTVPAGAERLRICVHGFNEKGHIEACVKFIFAQ